MSSGRRSVTVWLSEAQWAAADAAAAGLEVETGALIKRAAVTGILAAAAEVSAGRVRLRARSSRVPVPAAAAETSLEVLVAGQDVANRERAAAVVRAEDGAVRVGVDSKIVPVPRRPAVDRVAAFRAATQRGVS